MRTDNQIIFGRHGLHNGRGQLDPLESHVGFFNNLTNSVISSPHPVFYRLLFVDENGDPRAMCLPDREEIIVEAVKVALLGTFELLTEFSYEGHAGWTCKHVKGGDNIS